MSQENFDVARKFTDHAEGGWQNNGDRGGETIFGVARIPHPKWPGWTLVDAAKSDPTFPRNVNNDAELRALAVQFFREEFWNAIGGDALPLPLAVAVYDQAVNFGPDRAVKEMQAVLDVGVDGIVGPATARAAFAAGPEQVKALLTRRVFRYLDDVRLHPEDERWLPGWISRVVDLTWFTAKL